MKELDIQNKIRIFLSSIGVINFRNNVGVGWAGKSKRIRNRCTVVCEPGDVVIRNARPLRAGLCKGSADVIGYTPIEITNKMIGKKICVFTAVEVKSKTGKATKEQINFIDSINGAGGFAFIARSVDETKDEMRKQMHGLSS